MSITETAKKNHSALFLNEKSELAKTDPELVEILDNFAFYEVLKYSTLDSQTRIKVILAMLIASQSLNEYKSMLKGSLNIEVTPIEVKEIVYQAVAYVGFAKVFDFINATNDIFIEKGISLPLEKQSTTSMDTRMEEGLKTQKNVFGNQIDDMYKKSPKDQIHFQYFLSDNCFGDYYTRNGLDIKTHELITFVFILTLGGCEPQIRGHIQGNINVGNDKKILISTLTCLVPFIGYPRTLNALRCINEIISE